MGNEWRNSTWGEEISLEYGKGVRGYKDSRGPYRVYGSNGPVGWTSTPLVSGPGVILGRKGAYRGVEYSKGPFSVIDTAYYVKPKREMDMRWVYYAIKYYRLGEIDDGSPIPSTTRAAVYVQELKLPPPNTQRRIASILGSLDDKIELNRRMNQTLEKMAAALFKSWFIDFDPVHAKAQGDPTAGGLPPHIANLFPDSFEESELGPIPKGWKVKSLTEVIEVNPRRTLSKGTPAPFLDMSNMPTQGPSPDTWRIREMGSGMKFINGDTLMARITPCLENGKTAFVDFLAEGEVGWGSTEYIVLRPKGEIPPLFAYLLARTDEFRSFAIRQMMGSSGRQRVPAESLSKYMLITPEENSPVFHALGHLTTPLFNRIRVAMENSRNLGRIRDILLPQLMTGDISV